MYCSTKSDGNYFDVLINVKNTGNEHYVYDITLKEATPLPDQLRSYDRNSIASNAKIPQSEQKASKKSQQDNKIQYSVTDNKGRTLTKEQQEKFKDSVVRDKDGNLLTMYHGTPNGDYTVLTNGAKIVYCSTNEEYIKSLERSLENGLNTSRENIAPYNANIENSKGYDNSIDVTTQGQQSWAEYIDEFLERHESNRVDGTNDNTESSRNNSIAPPTKTSSQNGVS